MHEQSETTLGPTGWLNVYGEGTPRAGQPLKPKYPFEQSQYPTMPHADQAAELRSMLHGYFGHTGRDAMQPQLLPPHIINALRALWMIRMGLR